MTISSSRCLGETSPPPSKVQRYLRATSCCCPFAGDTSARGCRAALAAGRGSLPQWGRRPHSPRRTPTRRARGAGAPCGRWPVRPGQTDGRPARRGAPRPLVDNRKGVSVKIISTLKVWCVCYGLTGENEADRCRLQEEENLFAERHGDAYRPHDHQEQAEERQHGCRHIQVCTEEEASMWTGLESEGWGTAGMRVALKWFNSLEERLLVKHHWEIFSRTSFLQLTRPNQNIFIWGGMWTTRTKLFLQTDERVYCDKESSDE